MKFRIAIVASVLMLGCTGGYAQSSYDIEARYGKGGDVYSVSERLWMTPTYDSQGQVCRMRVYPKTVSQNVNYLDSNLDINESLTFINELFPVSTRGRRSKGFGLSDLGGGIAWTRFNYEHVHFVFISSFRFTKLPELEAENSVILDLPEDEAAVAQYRSQQEMKSDDQLIREHVHNARILEIVWPKRKCVKL